MEYCAGRLVEDGVVEVHPLHDLRGADRCVRVRRRAARAVRAQPDADAVEARPGDRAERGRRACLQRAVGRPTTAATAAGPAVAALGQQQRLLAVHLAAVVATRAVGDRGPHVVRHRHEHDGPRVLLGRCGAGHGPREDHAERDREGNGERAPT